MLGKSIIHFLDYSLAMMLVDKPNSSTFSFNKAAPHTCLSPIWQILMMWPTVSRSVYPHLTMKRLLHFINNLDPVRSSVGSREFLSFIYTIQQSIVLRLCWDTWRICTRLVPHFLALLLPVPCNPCSDELHLHYHGGESETADMNRAGFILYKFHDPESHQPRCEKHKETTAHQDT